MDETIRRCQEQLAKCSETIERSHEMVTLSRRWLTAYWDSINKKQRNRDVYEGDVPLLASAKAAASSK